MDSIESRAAGPNVADEGGEAAGTPGLIDPPASVRAPAHALGETMHQAAEQIVHYSDTYAVWPIATPVSRNFECQITAPHVGVDGRLHDFDARLKLRANTHVLGMQRENYLTIILHGEGSERRTNLERFKPVKEFWEELKARGFYLEADARAMGLRLPRQGSWRRYLLEVELAHAALEILGWELADDEQAIMDALDAYGRQAPARCVTAA